MTGDLPPLSPLGRWYGLLAGVASLAALQASLFPRWPQAAPLSASQVAAALQQAGLRPQPVRLRPDENRGQRSLEISVSAPLAFRFPGGEELRLVRGTARQRGPLQAASFAAKSPGLALSQRRLEAGPPPTAQGQLQGRPARQTCLVPHAGQAAAYGVTAEQLLPLVDGAAVGRAAELRRLIGLQANRDYGCVLVSLRSASGAPVSATLWGQVLAALPRGLAEPQGSSPRTAVAP